MKIGLHRISALLALCCGLQTRAQSTINATNRWAYGANTAWMDWRADRATGVVIGEYFCSGFIYAANLGWIDLGSGHPADGVRYRNNSAADFGVNHDGSGNLRGYAYGANVGWISFEDFGAPKVDLRTGRLSGNVYGGNIGWISLGNSLGLVQTDTIAPGADTDGDGIADAYEIFWTGGLTRMNASSDLDGDGVSDLREYLADTNPLDPLDSLRIIAFTFSPNGTNSSATWTARPTRSYSLQVRDDFSPGSSWADSGLGLIRPDAGSTTTRALTNGAAPQRFLRIEASRPLSP